MNATELNVPAKTLRTRTRGLSLQQKSWVITVGVLLALAALLTLGIDQVFGESSERLEKRWLAESARRVETAQAAEIDDLERTARDYATWSDTYEFMADSSRPYIENNLLPATFANLQLDAFLLFDTDGTLQTGRLYREGVVTPDGSGSLADALKPYASAVAAAAGRPIKGVMRVPEGLALVAMLPIHRDDGSGPPGGALAQVRLLNPDRVKRLRESVNLDVVLRELSGSALPRTGENLWSEFVSNEVDDKTMLVQIPVKDVRGAPIALWELTLAREIHLQGVRGRLIFWLVMTVLILAAAALMGWMLRVLVISRLEALHAAVQHVGATSDLSVRLSLKGADELTGVGEGINHMLEALERGEAARVTAELERERLNKQLQEAQKLEAIGTLTGGLAHDFNNLLTSIHGSTTLLRFDCPANFVGEEHLKRIEQATTQAARLVRQMMAFGRRSPSVLARLHLPVVVRDSLHLLRSSVSKQIEFRFFNEAVSDMVHADAAQLQQVIVNLATNAVDAMGDSSGQLTVNISEVQLPDPARPETNAVASGEYLRLSVSDTGVGIPASVLPRIFEPFFTTKPVGSGTGLGLAVVHGIVTQHHGTIGVESETGRGTTVIIHLPKIGGRAIVSGASSMVTNGTQGPGNEGNILLVDDDLLVRETLEAGLRHRKYRVVCATGGAQALKLVREKRGVFDAVITDQMMPGMTGIELGEILAHENPGLPLILVTGFASALNEAKVKAMGFSAMLMKPVTIDELDNAVRLAQQRDRPRKSGTADQLGGHS
jgi:signal transduction histidine kinase/CheY-like chemotaxis protein